MPETVVADMEGMYFQDEISSWPEILFVSEGIIHNMLCGFIMEKGNTDWGEVRVFDRGPLHG